MSKPADCPNCGRPTADDDSPTAYSDRHDPSFCSPITSPDCWEMPSGPVHYLVDVRTERTACGSDDGAGWSTNEGDVTCRACVAQM